MADSSKDVSSIDFRRQKSVLKLMANLLNVQSRQSRSAFITYGDTPNVVATFDVSLDRFNLLVNEASPVKGTRRMDLALESAIRLMSQARPQVLKIIVTFTGGENDIIAKPLQLAVHKLQDMSIRSYVIAFGENPKLNSLSEAVNKPHNLLHFPDLRLLRTKGSEIARHIAMSKYSNVE
ncbi:von Willebrand factor A domain-containing protein 1 [Exaiptasia diaphana]|nr:von Willebrand factor A domain-containing protein 1 [Exaiptasia diaphana]